MKLKILLSLILVLMVLGTFMYNRVIVLSDEIEGWDPDWDKIRNITYIMVEADTFCECKLCHYETAHNRGVCFDCHIAEGDVIDNYHEVK